MITPASLENLKNQLDIVEIVSHYIDLRRVGSNYAARCPFHDEKTPSFIISPARNIYHCYGCGASGDAITFVMEYEKLNFIEAVEKLADITNIRLEYDSKTPHKSNSLDKIMAFYHSRLLDSKEYLHYLHTRGIDDTLIATFNLGFCPGNNENLQFINAYGLDSGELLRDGVLGKNDSRIYARFFERIIFPIYSPSAKIVGFGGRSLKEGVAKYINSPQSQIFNKSKLLYGYHLAKEHIFKRNQLIITEGYIDVIMLHKAGIKNAVATLGTALTKDHIPLLNKGNSDIIVSYDGDKAGINAAFKAASLLAPLSKKGGVVIFPNGADPADMILAGKQNEVQELFARPIPFIEFCFQTIASKYNLANPLSKEEALKETSAFLHSLSPLMQEEYIMYIANLLHIPPKLITTKSSKKPAPIPSHTIESQGDRLERIILRYMLEDERFLEKGLDFLDSKVFKDYKNAFLALCQNNKDNPQLIGIMLDPLPIKHDGFEAELRIFLLRYFEEELKKEQNFQNILQLKQKILKLKQGELQPV